MSLSAQLLLLPQWSAILLLIGITVSFSIAGFFIVHRFVPVRVRQIHNDVAGFLFATLVRLNQYLFPIKTMSGTWIIWAIDTYRIMQSRLSVFEKNMPEMESFINGGVKGYFLKRFCIVMIVE